MASRNGNWAEGSTWYLEEYRGLPLLGRDSPGNTNTLGNGVYTSAGKIPGGSGWLEEQGVTDGRSGPHVSPRRCSTSNICRSSPTRIVASGQRAPRGLLVHRRLIAVALVGPEPGVPALVFCRSWGSATRVCRGCSARPQRFQLERSLLSKFLGMRILGVRGDRHFAGLFESSRAIQDTTVKGW